MNYFAKFLLIVITCLTVLAGCGKTDLPGDVEDVTEASVETATATMEETPTQPQIQWEKKTVYLCISSTMTQHDGSGSGTFEFEYDEYGNQIRKWYVSFPGDRNCKSEMYAYDENGNMISSVSVSADGVTAFRYDYAYDENGNRISEISTNADGKMVAEEHFTYSDDNWLIRRTETTYYKDPSVNYDYTVTYSDGNAAATIQKQTDGVPSGYTEETYDANGSVTCTDNYSADGAWKSKITYSYNERGMILCEKHFSSSELQADYDVNYTYDENDCLISMDVDYYYGYIMEYVYKPFEILVPIEN